ncbi:MAG: RtcB family protein [Saprospiraceae bacterium]
MAKFKLRGKDLLKLGFEQGPAVGLALEVVKKHLKFESKETVQEVLANLAAEPESYLQDTVWQKVALKLVPNEEEDKKQISLNPAAKDYQTYGQNQIEEGAKDQMNIAMRLPVAEAGALMPDAHHGYGLPIGGVLATRNSVIPYGVGMDIGCRMCLSVYDLKPSIIDRDAYNLKKALKDNTRFGQNIFDDPIDDPVLERSEFSEIKKLKELKNKAWRQMGSSGSGNHFVEFGIVEIKTKDDHLDLELGQYLAVLSHSGSRGLGANVAQHYTKIAREQCLLPKQAQHLAWLDLDSEAGTEYWLAMNLAGDYASACHHDIHRRLGKFLGHQPIRVVENHHNFAWKETINGQNYIVHRKGATPAGKNILGVIPGSMTAPAFIVKGKGQAESLNSASHGAGRKMSRTKAKATFTRSDMKQYLKKQQVELIGAGLDESPFAYKDIHQVMQNQRDLVEVLGNFYPKIVRMAKD